MSLLSVLFLAGFVGAVEAPVQADLFALNSDRQKKLFELQVEEKTEGDVVLAVGTFRDLNGEAALIEETRRRGTKVISMKVDQRQLKEQGLVEVEGNQLVFTLIDASGTKKVSREKLSGEVVVPGTFNAFVRDHWGTLEKGEAVDFRFAVWFRRETVGFRLSKLREEEWNGEPALRLRMKPSSFLIAALVDPLEFVYAKADRRLLTMKGRVAPKQLIEGQWKDLDAEVIYSRPSSPVSK